MKVKRNSQEFFLSEARLLGVAASPLLLLILTIPGCYETEELNPPPSVLPQVDEKGAISSVEVTVDGHWYVYGDAYGEPSSCMDIGKHIEEDCSVVTYPPLHLPDLDFPNLNGKMCTSGVVARVLTCCTEATAEEDTVGTRAAQCTGANETNCLDEGTLDHSSIWGAGIGFDLDLQPAVEGTRDYQAIGAREPWNAGEHRVIGISFDLQWHSSESAIPLRIEFPVRIEDEIQLPPGKGTARLNDEGELEFIAPGGTLPAGSSSEEHPYGSPFWQKEGESLWNRSPIEAGRNVILWKDIMAPPEETYNYTIGEPFEGDGLLAIQFHVIPFDDGETSRDFSFCVNDLRFLTE